MKPVFPSKEPVFFLLIRFFVVVVVAGRLDIRILLFFVVLTRLLWNDKSHQTVLISKRGLEGLRI